MFKVEAVTTLAELAPLAGEWNALADGRGDPLMRHEWFMAAAVSFARDGDLRVIMARDSSGLRAVAPLVRARSGGVARHRLLGFQLMEPQTFVHDDAGALRAACAAALKAGLPLSLPRMAAASEELAVLSELAGATGLSVVRPSTTRTHATVLSADWPAFEKAMTSRQASIIRRRRKRLAEEHGEVVFEALSPDEASAEAALGGLLRVEAAGWKAREGTALLHDAAMGRFIKDYARRAAAAGLLRVFNLRAGGEVVASQMVVECGERLWGIKLGADERFHKYGVGVMVTHDIMRWGGERGLKTFEHLGVAEAYQERWPLEIREQSTFHFYPRSVGGGAAFTVDGFDFARRRLKSRLEHRRRPPREAGAAPASEVG